MSESWQSENDEKVRSTETSGAAGQTEASPSVAEMLRSAREKKGLSQKDVADQLYLTASFIRDIDEGAFDRISKPAFIKGYLRSYARVVQISGDDVVASYQKSLDEAEQTVELREVAEESLGPGSFTGPVVQTGIAGLAGLLLIVALVWWLVSDDAEQASETVPAPDPVIPIQDYEGARSTPESMNAREDEGVDVGPTVRDETIESEFAFSSGVEPAPAEPDNINVAFDEVEETPVSEPAGPAKRQEGIQRVTEGDTRFITVNAAGDDRIELTFSDECWVEITNGDGTSIYSDLNREGDLLTVNGIAPFDVLLGRATSVTMRFNDEAIDLDRYTALDQTARISLGD